MKHKYKHNIEDWELENRRRQYEDERKMTEQEEKEYLEDRQDAYADHKLINPR